MTYQIMCPTCTELHDVETKRGVEKMEREFYAENRKLHALAEALKEIDEILRGDLAVTKQAKEIARAALKKAGVLE